MESHLVEWLNLLIRWAHFIVGVAWIGASFYFNWLENQLDRRQPQEEGIAGHLWAVHGGGFYHLKKFHISPEKLPERLHWFKWEAYMTWVSGMCLLAVVYYFNARAYLIDTSVADLTPTSATLIGLASVISSWFIYDFMCKSSLRNQPMLLSLSLFLYLFTLAVVLTTLFSGRGAYIHVGAAIGTIMVANVFFVIIPAQKELVNALIENRTPDPQPGKNGLLRSRHNNYLTLPVLFIMISNHFPSTYGAEFNWLVLALISILGVAVRHYFNVRHLDTGKLWIVSTALLAAFVVIIYTTPKQLSSDGSDIVSTADIRPIIDARCSTCHSATPTQAGFSNAPLGLSFDDNSVIEVNAQRVFAASVTTKVMPPGNISGMTNEEREVIARWYVKQQQH